MNLQDYLRVLRARWFVVAGLTVLGLAVAAAATVVASPTYEATTRLFVSAQGAAPTGTVTSSTSQLIEGNDLAQDRVKSYAQIATSARVLQPVIDSLGLATTPEGLAGRVSAEAPDDTVLINVSVTAASAQEAASTANAVGASLTAVVPSLEQPAAGSTTPVTVSTVQEASPPSAPLSPDPLLNLVLGALVGLALGLGLALLLEVLDLRVRDARDIAPLGTPVLGVIPKDPDAHRQAMAPGARTRAGESYRQLRTNLRHLTETEAVRSVAVTSSVDGEGKSATAANLAALMADAGVRVLLVDADLRRPGLTAGLGMESLPGLSTLLAGQVAVMDVLQPHTSIANLTFLPSGPVPENPSELLSAEPFARAMVELEATHDLVIVDAGPLVSVTDAVVISRRVGGVLLVVKSGAVRTPTLERALASLDAVDARLLGAVLTMARHRGRRGTDAGYAARPGVGGAGTRPAALPERPRADDQRSVVAPERLSAR